MKPQRGNSDALAEDRCNGGVEALHFMSAKISFKSWLGAAPSQSPNERLRGWGGFNTTSADQHSAEAPAIRERFRTVVEGSAALSGRSLAGKLHWTELEPAFAASTA